MSFKWENVNIEVENTNKNIEQPFLDIIKNSSGEVNHGEIYAIMGPSGGGKTTLLNALAGRIPINSKTQGEITYNNKVRNKSQWLKMVGFVNQDDCVYDDLTILETLTYAAKFRLNNQQGGKHTNEEISVIVDKVISDLKLNGVSKNEVKKLSGGERKRLSLGIELITDPPLIFLDEPTSGLDTLTALKICKILKELAVEKKKIILLTIHQPSQEIFYLFDHLLLLSKGNAIYNGRVDQAERYFMEKQIVRRSLITLPEFIVEICSDDFKDENPHLFYCEESIFKDDIVIKEEKIRKKKNDVYINVTPNLRHIFLLLKRKFTIETHRKMNFLKAQGAKMIIYLFLVYFNYQSYKLVNSNATAFLGLNSEAMEVLGGSKEAEKLQFAFCTALIVTSTLFLVIFSRVSSTITSFFDEVPFVKRELAVDSYSVASYFVSLLLYQILIETFAPVIACILMHRYVPVTNIYVIAALLLTGLFTVPFGLCIGSISTAKQIVIILSSVFGTLSSIPTSTISELIQRYGTNADGSRNGFSHLTYLTVILSPLYWSAFLINSCYKAGIDSVSSNYITNMLKERVGDIMVKNASYINGHHLSMWLLFILMIVSPIFCILIGIVLLGLNLMPDIRMRLEKDYKNKSK